MADTRDIVLSVLMDIEVNNTFSNIAINKALRQNQFSDKTDRAFITRLAEGVTEYRLALDYIINQFSKTKINKCKPLIRCLLRMGVYQIIYMDSVPDSAACNEAVKLAKKHGFGSLSGFVNGVLRNIARNKELIEYPSEEGNKAEYLSVKYSIPVWLSEKLLRDYPNEGEQIIAGSFADRGTTIRVNTLKTTTDELKKLLTDSGITALDGIYDDKALIIKGYDFIRKVPGYRQGFFTVQDESSMCAVRAAGIKPGDIVIDVCAAPGGKTTAAAEYLEGQGMVYSMDISEDKLELIEENTDRLGIRNVRISRHDATEPLTNASLKIGTEADEHTLAEGFADVVIADLPCSGLGIIGRKNDIKYRLDKKQLSELVSLQRSILDVVCRYVKPGGTLLYSTCTINPNENQDNVKGFLEKHKDYELVSERLFLQGIDKCDGFYYAELRKLWI